MDIQAAVRPRRRSPRTALALLAPVLALLLPATAGARIEAPDHVLYGNATLFGQPAPIGVLIEVRAVPGDALLARYVLGREPRLGGQFALGIPMDNVEPRLVGRARPGDPVRLYIGAQLAGETTVGEEGVAVRLDIDPQNLGAGPALSVADVELPEGNAGTSTASFAVSLNTTSAVAVEVDWQTLDGTATGGLACAAGIDYVSETGRTTTIPAGELVASIDVLVCGDTEIEPNETFEVELTAVRNAAMATGSATGTVLDDDNVPVLDVPDARAPEPAAGTAPLVFRPRLSRVASNDVRVDWSAHDGSAQGGSDYISASGTAIIEAGGLETTVVVELLADSIVEADEHFTLQLSSPVNAVLARDAATGTVVDPAFDPALEDRDGPDSGTVPALVQPSAVAPSPDGAHVYVASESGDSVLVFVRDPDNGALSFQASYTSASAGFSGALLDGARDVVVSADGGFVYVAARNDDAIAVLARTPATGALAHTGSLAEGQLAGGATISGLDGVVALALSPDGHHLYAVGRTAGALVAFARDPTTGMLSFLESETNGVEDPDDAGGVVVGLDQPAALLVSPDGAQVYVAARFGDALLRFTRDGDAGSPGFGTLSFAAVHQDGLLGILGLDGAADLALSADGLHLYVVGEAAGTVALFDRAGDGSLVQRRVWTRGAAGLPGLEGANAIALTDDGEEVYVTGFLDSSLTVFRRVTAAEPGLAPGDLVPRQTLFDDQGTLENMGGPAAIAISPDDRNAYVAASTDNAIVVLIRQAFLGVFSDGFDD